MADFPGERLFIQQEQVVTRRPVSESLMQPIAGSVNHILANNYMPVMFKLNGPYKGQVGKIRIDGFFRWMFDAEIINITIFNGDAGSSGTTDIDIKMATSPGGVFTSIFATRPAISSAAAANVWCGIGDSVTGCQAPVLSSSPNPFTVNAGDVLRMDIITVMGGNPRDVQIQIDWLPR